MDVSFTTPSNNPRPANGAAARSRPKATIRTRLLAAVGWPLAVLAIVWLGIDFSKELSRRLEIKRISLEEEAKVLLPAVVRLHDERAAAIQGYIDDVCGRMRDAESPSHHIAVTFGEAVYQSTAHGRNSSEMLAAVLRAGDASSRRARFGGKELVVGTQQAQDIRVYVAESLDGLRWAVLRAEAFRFACFVALATLAAAIIYVFELFIVSQPLEKLVTAVREIGKGRLGSQCAGFQTKELNSLAEAINAMSSALANAEKRQQVQLKQARDIQRNLLPHDVNPKGFHRFTLFEPAEDVGGDFFDLLGLPDGSWLVALIDVSGHGIPAAMNAALLKAQLGFAVEVHTSPTRIMQELNRRFFALSLDSDFATAILMRIDAEGCCVQYSSAGHEPAWLLAEGGRLIELPSTGLLLGVEEDAIWQEHTIPAIGQERILMTSDGVSETADASGRLLGRPAVGDLLRRCGRGAPDQTIAKLRQLLNNRRGSAPRTDDVTAVLLALQFDGVRTTPRPPVTAQSE